MQIIDSKMISISIILKNIKNLLPYFLLIAIYFFFVNLEATKDTNSNLTSEKEPIYPDKKNNINHNNLRIKIPVIPYNK